MTGCLKDAAALCLVLIALFFVDGWLSSEVERRRWRRLLATAREE